MAILPMGSFLTERSNTSEPAFIYIFSEIFCKKSGRTEEFTNENASSARSYVCC